MLVLWKKLYLIKPMISAMQRRLTKIKGKIEEARDCLKQDCCVLPKKKREIFLTHASTRPFTPDFVSSVLLTGGEGVTLSWLLDTIALASLVETIWEVCTTVFCLSCNKFR